MMRAAARLLFAALTAGAAFGGVWLAREASGRAEFVSPRPTEIVYDRNGLFVTQIARAGSDADYGYWPLERIPKRLAQATLALEDRRFYAHGGIDVLAVLRAGWRNLTRRGAREGASTIAMQVARMQLQEPRTVISKVVDAATAVAMIQKHGHEATLAHYLRLAPYGFCSHGAAHAARFYFDKPVEDLSWAETALLAAIPQAPGRMNLARVAGLRRATARATRALDELARTGALDAAQAELAKSQLAAMAPLAPPRRPENIHIALRYGRLVRDGKIQVAPTDPRIHASIDLSVEEKIAGLARRYLNRFRDAGARQVAVIVAERGAQTDPGNAIVAEVGSARFGGADAGAFDFTRVSRSPGSTLKPFVYALAFERGALKTTDILADIPEGASGINNADGLFLGPMTPRQALANSRNVPAANLLRRAGLESNFYFLHELGLHDIEAPPESFGASMAIGSLPTKLENLVRAYGALADDGVLSDLVYAREQRLSARRRVLSVDTARLVTSFLADPQARLPTFPRYGPLEYPFAVAVKTGTSQGYRDAWTLAYSKKFIVGVWLGRADAGTMKELGGAASSARLAHAALALLHGAKPGEMAEDGFTPPPDRVAMEMCLGRAATGECFQTLREWMTPEEASSLMQKHEAAAADERRGAPRLGATSADQLKIATPESGLHVWRNPELPAAANRLALKVAPLGGEVQVVWYVDGEPYITAEANQTVFWPLRPGSHKIQARLALQTGASRSVRVTVE